MPRPPRIDVPDAVYHVTSRGNGRADIFSNDEDRQRFLAQLRHHLHFSPSTCTGLSSWKTMSICFAARRARTSRVSCSDCCRLTPCIGVTSAGGRAICFKSVGCAKSVAVELAANWPTSAAAPSANIRMLASAIGANRRRLAMRPELLQVIETLARLRADRGQTATMYFRACRERSSW